jgi:hypothetical protein
MIKKINLLFFLCFLFCFSFVANAQECGSLVLEDGQKVYISSVKIFPSYCDKVDHLIDGGDQYSNKSVSSFLLSRYGEKFVFLKKKKQEKTINEILLENGFGFYLPMGESSGFSKKMLEAEKGAIDNKKGIWKSEFFIKNETNIENYLNSYQIVKAKIKNVYENKRGAYLSVSKNWKTDFTVFVPKKTFKKILKQNKMAKFNEGSLILVRGWVKSFNGPMIEVSLTSQLQML